MYIYVYICIYVYMYNYIYVCVCGWVGGWVGGWVCLTCTALRYSPSLCEPNNSSRIMPVSRFAPLFFLEKNAHSGLSCKEISGVCAAGGGTQVGGSGWVCHTSFTSQTVGLLFIRATRATGFVEHSESVCVVHVWHS